MTYQRYKAALEMIAAGCDDPATVAAEALRSRVVAAKPKPPRTSQQEKISEASRGRAISLFQDWVQAGRPPYSRFAVGRGISGTRVGQLLKKGRRMLLHPARKDHPLREEAIKDLRPRKDET